MAEDLARSIRAALVAGLTSGSQPQVALDGLDGLSGKNNGPEMGLAGRFRATGNVVVAPPTVACAGTEGAAGNVNVGVHQYAFTYVRGNDESSPGPVFALTINASAKHGSMTAVAVGPTGTTARRVYRSAAGDTVLKLAGTIADNSTTTFDDNVADGSLGAAAPTGQPEVDTYQEHGRRGLYGGATI